MKTVTLLSIFLITFFMTAQKTQTPTIDVSGEGIVLVIPDQAIITVRAEHTGKTPIEVKQQNDATINEVFKLLKSTGIEDRYVKSEYINLSKNYDYQTKTYNYLANQTIKIVLNDLSQYESIMNGLLATGINRIDGVSFTSSNSDALQSEARVKAIQNAKQKATEYAGALNQNVGKAIHISEFQQNSGVIPVYKSARMMDAGAPEQTMSPGEMEIRITVTVSFELI